MSGKRSKRTAQSDKLTDMIKVDSLSGVNMEREFSFVQ